MTIRRTDTFASLFWCFGLGNLGFGLSKCLSLSRRFFSMPLGWTKIGFKSCLYSDHWEDNYLYWHVIAIGYIIISTNQSTWPGISVLLRVLTNISYFVLTCNLSKLFLDFYDIFVSVLQISRLSTGLYSDTKVSCSLPWLTQECASLILLFSYICRPMLNGTWV